ncbi:helix-turn-helix domain-containing protein [Streptomyces sp. NPDC047082]|uniref:helix-turn-helix domain-containing protein n=1 Tax=Streptomyces sp. NPDC047082 TaxID=3155259 RepID=UPI0033D6E47E
MVRPPALPPEEKVRIVLSILAGEITVAEAARRAKASEQSVGNWKRQFLESGRAGLAAGKSGPSSRKQQLEAQVADLTQALGEAAVELRVWEKSAEGRLGPCQPERRRSGPVSVTPWSEAASRMQSTLTFEASISSSVGSRSRRLKASLPAADL